MEQGLCRRPEVGLRGSFLHYAIDYEGRVEIESEWTAIKRELEQRKGLRLPSNFPTQARLWLEWEVRVPHSSYFETGWPTQGFFCLEWVSFIQLR